MQPMPINISVCPVATVPVCVSMHTRVFVFKRENICLSGWIGRLLTSCRCILFIQFRESFLFYLLLLHEFFVSTCVCMFTHTHIRLEVGERGVGLEFVAVVVDFVLIVVAFSCTLPLTNGSNTTKAAAGTIPTTTTIAIVAISAATMLTTTTKTTTAKTYRHVPLSPPCRIRR